MVRITENGVVLEPLSDAEIAIKPVEVGPGASVESLQVAQEQCQHMVCRDVPFVWTAVTWGLTAVLLQIVVLILLTFEPPGETCHGALNGNVIGGDDGQICNSTNIGLVDSNDVIRFISDNIDSHRGYGSVMLLAFGASFVLLLCILVEPLSLVLIYISVLLSAAGGVGVVVYHHGNYSTHHIFSAALFIVFGVGAHLVAILSGPRRHIVRDCVLFLSTACFASTFVLVHTIAKGQGERHDIWLRGKWWVAGIAEYLTYISVMFLNVLIPERIIENLSFRIVHALPTFANVLCPKIKAKNIQSY